MTILDPEVKSGLVSFSTSSGLELRATPLRITRHEAVFEIYDPTAVLRLSEVLTEFRIVWHERTLYSGRATVRNVVTTGLLTVCEAELEDPWYDLELSLTPEGRAALATQFTDFLQEWQRLYRIAPEYKAVVADLQTFLSDLRLWLDQVELGIRAAPSGDRASLEREVVNDLGQKVVPVIHNLFDRFENVAGGIEEELQPAHYVFGRRQLHPLLLASPFVYRTFRKPLGYAGDYEMVNMMFREAGEGPSVFAKVVNAYALQLPPIRAHRNRIGYLAERLTQETLRRARTNQPLRVFDLGCGPAHEIQTFLAQGELSSRVQFTLTDFNDETLEHVKRALEEKKQRFGRQTQIRVDKKSVQQLIKQSERRVRSPEAEEYDLVYCAGLFDYLSDKVCRKLMEIFYEMLAPGGLLIATNVDVHPSRGEMEHFLDWHLVHRNTAQMAALRPEAADPEAVHLLRDDTGVNVFMEVRKTNGAA